MQPPHKLHVMIIMSYSDKRLLRSSSSQVAVHCCWATSSTNPDYVGVDVKIKSEKKRGISHRQMVILIKTERERDLIGRGEREIIVER